MKNKYLALFMAVVLCCTFLFSTVAFAGDIEVPEDVIEGALEGVLGKDPGEVGNEMIDDIYAGRDFLRMINTVLENIKILLSNALNSLFEKFNALTSSSNLG